MGCMKKLILLLVMFTSLPLFAQKTLELAYEASDYTYREPAMKYPISLKGRLQGGSLRYETRMRDSSMFAALEARFMGGSTDYDGYLMDGTKYYMYDLGDYYYEGRLRIGQVYDFTEEMQLWLGSGIGYRYLKDHADKDPSGYLRESTYIYLPVTASLRYNADWFSVALNGEFDCLIFGHQMSHLPYDYPFDDIRNDQHKGFGVRAGLKMQVNVSPRVGVFAEPFYRYWQIAESEMTYGFVEPYNTTEEYGVRVGLTFYLGGNEEVYSM